MRKKTGGIMRRLLSSIIIIVAINGYAKERVDEFLSLLEANRIEEAETIIKFVRDEELRTYLNGILHFYKGNYDLSVSLTREYGERGYGFYPELISNTWEIMKDAERIEKGKFSISLTKRDEVMKLFIEEALEEAYNEVGKIFGYYPQKVRIEIYPDRESFSKATTLKEMEIMNTGTVGVCKFNKIMLLTPRVLVQGYPWAKTLRHEYIHYVVTYLTRNNAPVWLQEAIAKYFDGEGLSDSYLYLLKRRMEEGKLIKMEDMHPSIAKLPTAEDAALAFAEVHTMMELFIQKRGIKGLLNVLNAVENGTDAITAFENELQMKFDEFYKEWIEYVKKKVERTNPAELEKLVFKDEKVKEKKRGKHEVLGDTLLERGFVEEALFEYEKEIKGESSPQLLNKTAFLYMKLGRYEEALKICDSVLKNYPFNYTANFQKGKVLNLMGKKDEAIFYLKSAAYINPFDPELLSEIEKAKR
jgi:tetratricopeptide (TPR) repeat protein